VGKEAEVKVGSKKAPNSSENGCSRATGRNRFKNTKFSTNDRRNTLPELGEAGALSKKKERVEAFGDFTRIKRSIQWKRKRSHARDRLGPIRGTALFIRSSLAKGELF